MMDRNRIVVFTGDLSFSVRKGIVTVDRTIDGLSWLVLVNTPGMSVHQLLKNQWRNFRRNGWRWIPYQAADIWRRLSARDPAADGATTPGHEFSQSALQARPGVRVLRVQDLHSPAAIEAVKAFDPHLGVALAAPILRRTLFSVPKAGTINLHKGKVPAYRGMPPAFWEMWNDEKQVGCTVHWVDDKLDTGAIAAESVVDREPYSTVRGLQLTLDEVGTDLLTRVVGEFVSGRVSTSPQPSGGTTYRKPTLAQVVALDRRVAALDRIRQPMPKILVKSALSLGLQTAWRMGTYRVLRPRITVLLYHRVSDTVRDNLTVGIEQFERQMGLIRRHCKVLSLQEVLDCRVIPASREPLVCVTFDDGYLDNYSNAVPILVRNEVPAAFFVSTGIVGTQRPFPHDLRRGNPPIPAMDWNHLRMMRDQGFAIGSHTVNHVDCARESEDVVWSELTCSRDRLRRELGLRDVILGYPYGGRQHMTPERLDLVRQAGYAGCLSAYGGSNLGSVDRFNVLRRGIHWEFFDRAFMHECIGLT